MCNCCAIKLVSLDRGGRGLGRTLGLELGYFEHLVALGLGRTCHWQHEPKCAHIVAIIRRISSVLLVLLVRGTFGFGYCVPILGFLSRMFLLLFSLVFRLEIVVVHGKFA
jgi:hypothetical protein